jgi:hypothetical protein
MSCGIGAKPKRKSIKNQSTKFENTLLKFRENNPDEA